MSHFSEPQRPAMRRKSSAQNLLSSFKSSNSSSSSPVPPPISIGPSSVASSGTISFSSAGTAATPTSATPLVRDWDAQSLHSETLGSTLGGAGSPQLPQGTSVEYLRDLVQKRVITLTYIRNIHEGRSHWFHTILISRNELDKVFNNNDMKKRTSRFAVLGLSLSSLLDINQPQDLLRGLLNTITEYDQAKEDGDKPKIRPPKRLFKAKNLRRGAAGIAEFSGSYIDSSDASYLFTPHIPFPLDYHQTLLSLLDVLSEVYNKISKLLGPSPFPHSSQHMMGPLGLLSPHPGVSYLFSGESTSTSNQNQGQYTSSHHSPNPNLNQPGSNHGILEQDVGSSLWGIANASLGGSGASTFLFGNAFGTPPVAIWTPILGEMVLKIDGKLKKITTMLLKDLDEFARNGIREELASLDPLLRNTKVADDGLGGSGSRTPYEYEAM